jgi:hypothetical protein
MDNNYSVYIIYFLVEIRFIKIEVLYLCKNCKN